MSNPITPNVPPGWFADPAGSQLNRWWDGTQWTDNLQAPYQAAGVPVQAPAGTSPSTVHIWLIVALFALQLVSAMVYLATVDFAGNMQSSMDLALDSSDPTSSLAVYGYLFTPGYLLMLFLSFAAYAGTIVLAYFDSKTLLARGIPKPFPWALAFIPSYGSMVYVIGRSVVVRRRTGSGIAPMWVYLAIFVAGFVAGIVVSIAMVGSMMNEISQYPVYGY